MRNQSEFKLKLFLLESEIDDLINKQEKAKNNIEFESIKNKILILIEKKNIILWGLNE